MVRPVTNRGSSLPSLHSSSVNVEHKDSVCWNSHDSRVPQLVAEQAAAKPGAIAVATAKERLTYAELDSQANALAHRLRLFGVGPDVVVGLCSERCPAMVVGALGILKAGGAYLLLDPAYPSERLAFKLLDAEVPVVVTSESQTIRVPAGPWRVISVDSEMPQLVNHPPEAQVSPTKAEHLAYVVYTSGSTGSPKGVAITHESLLNLVFWHRQAFDVTREDRASHLAGLSFDAAVWELWPYLTAGATVHLAPEFVRQSPESLRDWLVASRITISFVPSPLAERMLVLEWPPETALRLLLTGGDTLHHYPPVDLPFDLVNNYGPSECTVVATSGIIRGDARPASEPPIGRAITNTQIYILDQHLKQVPAGEVGEMYIGGVGLARGYLNRPDLTAERFVPNPFSPVPGNRLYRTGDLARCSPDGQIIFLGRIDDQIKVRGFRIEPGEIIAALNSHPEIQESFIVTREAAACDKQLVAYIVPVNAQITDAALREFLRKTLPDFMVPAVFVPLPALPLGPHGKVDRLALPVPDAENILRDTVYHSPRSPAERKVAKIVAQLLGLAQVGADDNFFTLGGHSLLGTQLIARLRQAFGVELPLRSLFEASTVAKLAAEVERLVMAKLEAMSEQEAQRILGVAHHPFAEGD
jgi:amino acid adenylation domain-containing protein